MEKGYNPPSTDPVKEFFPLHILVFSCQGQSFGMDMEHISSVRPVSEINPEETELILFHDMFQESHPFFLSVDPLCSQNNITRAEKPSPSDISAFFHCINQNITKVLMVRNREKPVAIGIRDIDAVDVVVQFSDISPMPMLIRHCTKNRGTKKRTEPEHPVWGVCFRDMQMILLTDPYRVIEFIRNCSHADPGSMI